MSPSSTSARRPPGALEASAGGAVGEGAGAPSAAPAVGEPARLSAARRPLLSCPSLLNSVCPGWSGPLGSSELLQAANPTVSNAAIASVDAGRRLGRRLVWLMA